ncbi:K02A2.6-like, partial [Cordylochernes scorpioides]
MLYLEATEKATKPHKLKVAILLNFIGEEALEVFNTFHLKEDEAENFDLVINKFDDFCEPKKNVIFERFKFFSATQKDGESIDSFITELKGLSTSCEFESQKDSLIRDRIVYGIQDKALQERLLREPNLTLLKAIEMCKTDEISKQQIKIMQNNQNICQIRKYEKKHSPKQNQESEKEFKCQRCGKSHRAKNCPAWGKRCSKCKKMNHFAAFCKSSAIRSLNDETEETVWSIHEAKVVHTLEWKKSIIVNGKEICFKLDSGAEVNVLPYTFTRQMKGLEIFQTNRKLTSYTGHEIKIKGIATLNCKTKNKTESLEFFIADGYYQPILGIEAIEKLSLIKKCDAVQTEQNNSAKEILNRHKNIFEGIGRLPIEHKIRLKENATPVIAPSRKIPFSIREKVKAELERMEKLDIIEKVEEPSEWTHPIVVVQKPSGDVRICMDPRELNKYVQRERYILPTAETIFSELKGATVFSVFDASSAFWQVPLDKESTNLCTIATPFGRLRFKRLPYGLNSASEVFQRCINNILSGLQGTACYMDDILIYGSTMEEHNRNLETVLRRLEENNVKLNAKKQQIAVDKVNFLGHIISRDGIAIQASRAEAIQKLKRPENKTEVQRFLGMVTYLGKFIPNLSDKTAPLRKLISNKSEWKFGGEEIDCFKKLKDMVSNAPILTFFDPTKPITISSDASQYGIGTVLMQGGHAIEYASFSLNATQRKYAQIEKELLAIVFGCERFQYYIWGNYVIVETDHKPLLSIVKKPLEKLSPRLQRMVLRLMRFQISLKFTPGKNMFVADHLSRDPLKDEVDTSYLEGQTESVHMLLVTTDEKIKRLQKETHGDHTLIQLIEYAKNGWPKYKTKVCDEAKPYWQFQDEIHVSDGIVYKGNCIMVPSTLRKEILQVVHSSHQGIAASKEKARSAFYWPGMITQVENEVEKCRTCQEYSRKNPEESRIAHEIPEFPWEKIAVDFMEVSGTSSILVVDYHSKFVEIRKLSSKRETETIMQLKTIFRTHGIPRTLVSDNGPPFNSTGFKNFAQKYEFKHQTSSPKYPRSNGQVERTIQTIKGLIIKAVKSGRDPNLALMEFNNTPKYDLPSPTQMLMGRSVRTLSTYTRQQLKPLFDTTKNHQKLRDHQQRYAGSPKRILRPLEVGDNIMLQERHRKWVPATVTAKHETPRSYMVKTPSGSEYRRNRSHLRPRKFSVEDSAPTIHSPSISGSQAGTAMDDNIQDHGRPTSENRRAYDPRKDVAKKAPEPFNFSNPGDWPKWIRRFERFRQASGLINNPENEQVNMLVYCMGDNADDILLSCKIASDQLENYNKVIECFGSHFIPRRNIIYERARFNQRCQQEGEKVNEFITALHSLAEHCNFGMLHDELIRDRIVVGVRDRALSERMQLDTDLTLVKATLMAKQLESVKEQQSSLYQQDSIDQIKKMPNHIKETKRHEPKIRQFKSNQLGGSSHGCTRCGNSNNHDWKNCPAMNSYCSKCKKKGHYAKVCRSEAINEIKSEIAFLGSVEDNSKKWIVPIKVNNRQINFKIDTGADVNVLPLQYYYQSFQRIKLEKSDKILQGPNGIPLETVGMIHVKLQNKGQHLNSKIYIVDKLKQPLLSGETSEKLNIVRMIQQLSSNFLNPKREFPEIFNGLGHAKINYKISLQPDAKPYALCTPRRVPIPLMKQVKEQLEEMTRLGVIESVEEPTEWCAGMVAVSKPGGKIRICVDLTKLNQYIRRENYPLPATEHILGQLGNACYFSKLDANSGFWQFGLAKESQKLTTFITPFGRFFFKRIPFGITSAPEIFQRKMTQLLGKIEGVVCFMDDIVVYGSSLEEHNERVRQVLKKIQEEGMTLNPEKCQFGVKTVKFLGHTLSSEGLFIDEEKLDAITKMEAPRSTKELKSFLGMVNYLGKFIPNLADKLQPLNSLLSTKNEWVWDEPQKKSFNLLKQELVSRPNLALFDPSRTTIVSADASSFGLGGVLRQEQPDGSLKPIAYVSRTLSETEKRYSQIEKEGLAIVWTCDRLKDYVTGIKIHIETDHKPLIAIFTSKSLEDMTPRLQRLKMRMMRYSYQISHIAGKKQIVADMLSRKPMSKPHKDELEEELSAYIQSIEFPATEERLLEISRKQKEDSLCSQLAKYCMSGWPKNKREVDPALRGYWQFQEDLTYQNGLLLRGQRILIPKSLRKDILEKLHQGHFGINKCRSRAKESVWWLGISQEIERIVSSCTKCLKERKPKHEPLMPSEFPIRPWQKVGMDLFYLNGRWYLIVCDYYSRYPEISLLQNLTAQEVISRLKSIFARHGTPETVRSDNGPQFQKVLGSEFSKFSKEWSFKHITSSPKFPQSNGFIEAIIKNIKQSFKKEEDCYLTLQAYRTMPLESGYSPAELLMGRRLRTSVPAIESSLMPRYLDSEALQEREKRRVINQKRLYDKRHDVHSLPQLQQGDSVWIRDQRVEGTVLHKSEEPRSYWVQTPQGKVRRNRLHLTPLPKMGSTMDASEDGQRQEQRNEETPTSTSTWLSRRCKDVQEQETEEDCPTPTASSTRDGRMQRDNQDQDPEKSLPSMPAVHTRYGRAVKIPRSSTPISTVSMPRGKIRAHYEHMSEFETGRAIGLKEA